MDLLTRRTRCVKTLAVAAVASVFVLAACSPATPSPAAPTPAAPPPASATATDYTRLSGSIVIDGSSTVFPITEAVAEEFGKLTRGRVRVTVGISGTGGGFKKFCNGETDIQNASRSIKESEAEACAGKGIQYIEVPVAIDGLSVLVNPQNAFASCMTVQEMKKLWEPAAQGKVTRWSQVRPNWPNEPVRLYGPGVDSGTFDYFTEAIVGKAQAARGDFTASEDDNVLVQGISGDKNALGFFGYAYYAENKARLKLVAIDSGNGCMLPTEETIANGTYTPLSRPIFIYVRKEAAARPDVREFVRYYLSDQARKLVPEVGYIPFPARVYELARARFEKGALGSIFAGWTPQKGSVQQVLAANQ